PVLERHGGMMGDRREERPLVGREVPIAVTDQLADLPSLPAERDPYREGASAALRPGDSAVLQNERGPGRADRLHRRLDYRLERLLEVQRLGDGFGNPRKRLELPDAALRFCVQLRMHDRLRNLSRHPTSDLDFP